MYLFLVRYVIVNKEMLKFNTRCISSFKIDIDECGSDSSSTTNYTEFTNVPTQY